MESETKHPTEAVESGGKNPLHELHALGQSVWLDYIRRGILDNGELEEMIRRYDLRGVTSNPSIFEQAIGDSDDYDDAFDFLAGDGRYKESLANARSTLHWLRLLPRWHPRALIGAVLGR